MPAEGAQFQVKCGPSFPPVGHIFMSVLTMLMLAGGIALLIWRIASARGSAVLREGDSLPGFTLADQNGTLHSAAEFGGRWLVLYFYPRDDTPGCTEQAAKFRDTMQEFVALGTVVCGISVDDSESHAAFARKYNLPYLLLADRDGAVARRFGSLRDLVFIKFARRNTYLFDPQGRVAKVYRGVNPARNAGEVLDEIKRRQP
jgi:peroxiredoxin Q/BCP